jgi:uncharacterized membrane protein
MAKLMNVLSKGLCSVAVALLVVGALPTWPYSAGWGYYPSGLGVILLIILVVVLLRQGSPENRDARYSRTSQK